MSASPSVTRESGGTVIVTTKEDYSALVVLSHGLGDTAEGWVDIAEMWAAKMPHVKFVLPTAPTQPVTLNGGMPMPSWYDIAGLDERSNEKCEGIDQSRATLNAIMAKENIPFSRMVLAGFSQGGALSLTTGLQMSSPLAGVLCMSGYLAGAPSFALTDCCAETPVMHCHGTADQVVVYAAAEKTRDHLVKAGLVNYQLKAYPGLPHSVSPEELEDALAFLSKVIPDDTPIAEMSVKALKAAIRARGLQAKAVGIAEKHELVRLLQEHSA